MTSVTLDWMRDQGVPVTPENWRFFNWLDLEPGGEEEMPEELRDWAEAVGNPDVMPVDEGGNPAMDAFDPQEPRGQPGNPGEWTAGGGHTTPSAVPSAAQAHFDDRRLKNALRHSAKPRLDLGMSQMPRELTQYLSFEPPASIPANVEGALQDEAANSNVPHDNIERMNAHIAAVHHFFQREPAVKNAARMTAAEFIEALPYHASGLAIEWLKDHASDMMDAAVMTATATLGVALLGPGIATTATAVIVAYIVDRVADGLGIDGEHAVRLMERTVDHIVVAYHEHQMREKFDVDPTMHHVKSNFENYLSSLPKRKSPPPMVQGEPVDWSKLKGVFAKDKAMAQDFDPNEPRGQPENAGEWTKGGAGKTSKARANAATKEQTLRQKQIVNLRRSAAEYRRRAKETKAGYASGKIVASTYQPEQLSQMAAAAEKQAVELEKGVDPDWIKKAFPPNVSNGGVPFYHGTSEQAEAEIMKTGLKPHASQGADAWANLNGFGVGKHTLAGKRAISVYMTKNPLMAEQFAAMTSQAIGSKPAVLRIDIPRDRLQDLENDEHFNSTFERRIPEDHRAYRFTGAIPPEWIHALTPDELSQAAMGHRKDQWLPDLTGDDDTEPFYLVIPCVDDDDDTAQDFDPSESRLPASGKGGGEWTKGSGQAKGAAAPYLVPALKWKGKVYYPPRGGDWTHHGVFEGLTSGIQREIGEELHQSGTPEAIFYATPEGKLLGREDARQYAEQNDLLEPGAFNQRDLISEQLMSEAADPAHLRFRKRASGQGFEAVSPSVHEIDFPTAVKELVGDRQKALFQASAEIDKGLGLEAHDIGVVGAWKDGAENAIATVVDHADWDKLKASAAMKAHLSDQKAALVFMQGDGDAALYSFHAKGDLAAIHAGLLEDGVVFHSLAPDEDGKGATIYVADTDGSAYEAVAKAAERFDAKVTYQLGKAEFIGSEASEGDDRSQRDEARRAYEKIIEQPAVPASRDIWAGVRAHWGQALGGPDG